MTSHENKLRILNFPSNLTSMKKPKNSLELPNPTRNTRKFANKLATDHGSGKIKDITCLVSKMKPARSLYSMADVIPFLFIHTIHTIKKTISVTFSVY